MMEVAHRAAQIATAIGSVILGKEEVIRACVVALLAGGHVIVEDFPGVGKTLLAKSLARSIDCKFARVQFTPDLLPGDVTGVTRLQPEERGVRVPAGPHLRQHRPGRRDQPRLAQDPVQPARVHGRAPGDHRQHHASHRSAVHGDRHPEPHRVRGHLPAARGPARPLHDAAQPGLSVAGGGGEHHPRADLPRPAGRAAPGAPRLRGAGHDPGRHPGAGGAGAAQLRGGPA